MITSKIPIKNRSQKRKFLRIKRRAEKKLEIIETWFFEQLFDETHKISYVDLYNHYASYAIICAKNVNSLFKEIECDEHWFQKRYQPIEHNTNTKKR